MSQEQINKHSQRTIIIMALLAILGSLSFGYNTGVINGALHYMSRLDQLNLTPVLDGLIGSAICLGCAVGALLGGCVVDFIGRKKFLIYLAILFFFTTLGCAFSINATMMIIGRFFLGIAVGGVSVIVPLYLSEIAMDNLRDSLFIMMELGIVLGQLLAYIVNAVMVVNFGDNTGIWRYPLGIGALLAIFFFLGMIYNRESPCWLVSKGRTDEALEVLKLTNENEAVARTKLNKIKNLFNEDTLQESFSKDLTEPWIIRIGLLGAILAIIMQTTGCNAILYYSSQMFLSIGLSTESALISNVVNGVIVVISTICSFYLVRKLTRRMMLGIGLIGTCCANFALGIAAVVLDISDLLLYISLGLTVVFLIFMSAFIAPVVWIVISEIFPLRMRAIGMGFAIFFIWMTVYAITFISPLLINDDDMSLPYSFFVYGGLGILGLLFVKYYMPETKGLSMEDIERKFRDEY